MMIIPTIISIIILNSMEDEKYKNLDYQLRSLSKEIYQTLPQEELDFLYRNMPGIIQYWLIEKYCSKFAKRIENNINDPKMLTIQNKYKIRPINNITPKQALLFAYLTFMITGKELTLENASNLASGVFNFYHSINTSKKININNHFDNNYIEMNIKRELDAASIDIMNSLSESEKKYLSEAPDIFVSRWIFHKMWMGLMLEEKYDYLDIIAKINDEMSNYLMNKYNLKISKVHEDEFKVFLTGAYLSRKLKNDDTSLEACTQIFQTYQYITMPKPNKFTDKKINIKRPK